MSDLDLFGTEQPANAQYHDEPKSDRQQKLTAEDERLAEVWMEASGLNWRRLTPQWQGYLRRFAKKAQWALTK